MTRSIVETYLAWLEEAYSVSHRTRIKSVLSSFCQWLIDEHELLKRNPTHGLELPPQQVLAPRMLSDEQRSILRMLVEQAEDLRGEALFALGYWAGCRVSEAGIHHRFRTLKQRATKDQWDKINDLSFHDLRHDLAHRAREAG